MKVLLIDGSINNLANSKGELNKSLIEFCKNFLIQKGYTIITTHIQEGYEPNEEINKFLECDLIIYQFPIWWFSQPWLVKKYIDEVFSLGWNLFINKWDKYQDRVKQYGNTGLLKNKAFMINTTWSAPIGIFNRKNSFMGNYSLNDILLPIIKQNEFIGMNQIEGFHCFDVNWNLNINETLNEYKKHLLQFIK